MKINFHVFKVLECVDLSLFSSKFYTKLYKLMDLSVEGPLVFCKASGSTQAFIIEWYTVEFVYSEQTCNEIRLITKRILNPNNVFITQNWPDITKKIAEQIVYLSSVTHGRSHIRMALDTSVIGNWKNQ